jgi:hypothetical protein
MIATPHAAVALLAAPALVVLAVAWNVRPAAKARDEHELAARLPAPDLAVANGSRQLRMPSLEEPWAPFHDAPGALDADPAGAYFLPERP